MRGPLFCFVILILSGCALDREADLRSVLAKRMYLAETEFFESKTNCTVGVFHLARVQWRKAYPRVSSLRGALDWIRAGDAVQFNMPGLSPNAISQQVISSDLPGGLGLLSTGVGPALDCMDARISRGYYRVLMSPDTITVYDAGQNALLLVYPPERLAFFLRGNV